MWAGESVARALRGRAPLLADPGPTTWFMGEACELTPCAAKAPPPTIPIASWAVSTTRPLGLPLAAHAGCDCCRTLGSPMLGEMPPTAPTGGICREDSSGGRAPSALCLANRSITCLTRSTMSMPSCRHTISEVGIPSSFARMRADDRCIDGTSSTHHTDPGLKSGCREATELAPEACRFARRRCSRSVRDRTLRGGPSDATLSPPSRCRCCCCLCGLCLRRCCCCCCCCCACAEAAWAAGQRL
mmetsp:Transcript_23459/g.89114  ORF Transcript_23459/g.89114 Transcript_23459/m.89114 type:complete len:244 (+) Transcript_23459:1567-2298(+)